MLAFSASSSCCCVISFTPPKELQAHWAAHKENLSGEKKKPHNFVWYRTNNFSSSTKQSSHVYFLIKTGKFYFVCVCFCLCDQVSSWCWLPLLLQWLPSQRILATATLPLLPQATPLSPLTASACRSANSSFSSTPLPYTHPPTLNHTAALGFNWLTGGVQPPEISLGLHFPVRLHVNSQKLQ